MNTNKEQLEVGPGGVLRPAVNRQIRLNEIDELQEVSYVPYGHETLLQLLPLEETKTSSGIILPTGSRGELRAVVAATNEHTTLTRGEVVRLDMRMFGNDGPWVDYVEGKPFCQVPNHFIKGTYTNVNLKDWKNTNNENNG